MDSSYHQRVNSGQQPSPQLSLGHRLEMVEAQVHIVVEAGVLLDTPNFLRPLNISAVALFVPNGEQPPLQSQIFLNGIQLLQLGALANRFDYYQVSIAMKEHLPETPFNNPCAICLDEQRCDQVAIRLSCLHVYHGDCILRWVARNHQCPLCRANME